MRFTLPIGAGVVAVALSLAACGGASTAPSTAFALDTGNYTLKLSGGATGAVSVCATSGSGAIEASMPVTVERSGDTWTVKAPPPSTLTMTFTTNGAASGVVTGSASGQAGLLSITKNNTPIDGRNAGTNIAGGKVDGTVEFFSNLIVNSCSVGTWTLTPR